MCQAERGFVGEDPSFPFSGALLSIGEHYVGLYRVYRGGWARGRLAQWKQFTVCIILKVFIEHLICTFQYSGDMT